MANVLRDDGGVPVPQYLNAGGSAFESVRGASGAMDVNVKAALPAGDNNIGNVDVVTLPALPAGSNLIGNVGITGTVTVDSELPTAAALADGASNPTTPMIGADSLHFNGATWDRQRGNLAGELLASSARTVTTNSSDQTNYNGHMLHVLVNVSAGSSFSLVVRIQAKDPVSGTYYDLLASAAITATGLVVLRVFPGATAAANLVANDFVPRTWRVSVEHGNSNSVTYSVGYALNE